MSRALGWRVTPSKPSLAMLPWYPGDFMTATRGWSVTARGVYRELLDAQWDMGALPEDPEALRTLINATPLEWRAGWDKCEEKFPLGADGRRRNWRLEIHRVKTTKLAEAKRKGAGITNAKRAAQRALSDTDSDTLSESHIGSHNAPTDPPLLRHASVSVSVSDSDPSRNRLHTPLSPQGGESRAAHGKGSVGVRSKSGWTPPKTVDEYEREEAAREEGESIRNPQGRQLPGGRHAGR
jgi:uncharacterized protein YdaU (DUF1376 family)